MPASQIGNRINTAFDRVAQSLVTTAKNLPVAVIGDISHRLFSFHGGFQNYSKKARGFAGSALTVRVRPGDNLFLHKALDIAQAGDIVVCNGGGAIDNALLGEMMGRYAASRGIAGIVIDGAIRDQDGLRDLDIPVYARAVTPNGPWKSGPGEVGYPIAAGGLSIASGDLVVADDDGIIVIPRVEAQDIIEKAKAHAEVEKQWAQQISTRTWPRGWVDKAISEIK